MSLIILSSMALSPEAAKNKVPHVAGTGCLLGTFGLLVGPGHYSLVSPSGVRCTVLAALP